MLETGYEFEGWYEGGILMPQTTEYEIRTDRNRAFTAKLKRLNEDRNEERQPQTVILGTSPCNGNEQTATPSNIGNSGRSSGGSSSSAGRRADTALTVLGPGAEADNTGDTKVEILAELATPIITVGASKYVDLLKTGDEAATHWSEYILVISGMLLLIAELIGRRRYVYRKYI